MQRNFPVQKCLSALAVPDVTEVLTGVIRSICPLPGPPVPLPASERRAGIARCRSACMMSLYNAFKTKLFFFLYQLNRNQLLRESFGTQKATPSSKRKKEQRLSTLNSAPAANPGLRGEGGRAARGADRKPLEVFIRNTIYSPLLVTSGQG